MRQEGYVKKGWGYELVWATNDKYCGKILVFEKKGSKSGMLFHEKKDKTWFINTGRFMLRYIEISDGTLYTQELKEGETWRTFALQPHQLEALVDNSTITEVSTADDFKDYFYIVPEERQLEK